MGKFDLILNYTNFDDHLHKLYSQIYSQPEDQGHTDWARDVIYELFPKGVKTVLDVGCGVGFCEPLFREMGVKFWEGTTLDNEDYKYAIEHGRSVYISDMTFLDLFANESFDLVFARHVLEHSPMPLMTLLEWARVSRKYALIVTPAHEYWLRGGQNHYYVLDKEDWKVLFDVAGWNVLEYRTMTTTSPVFLAHNAATKTEQLVEHRWLLRRKDKK